MTRITAALLLLNLYGCSRSGDDALSSRSETPPEPASIRLHLAADQPRPGWHEMTDRSGQMVYVSPAAELTRADVLEARALHSAKRSALQIVLNRIAAQRLHRLTRENIGARLAIIIDDELIVAQLINAAVTRGQVHIVGVFSRAEAEQLAAALNVHPGP